MAYYSKVHLKDKASETFLYSKGFHLMSSSSALSNWICGHIVLFFPIDYIILSDIDIYSQIATNYRLIGIETGKRMALNNIANSLTTTVFPEGQVNQEY